MGIYCIFTGLSLVLGFVGNAADRSCHLSEIPGKPKQFAFELWGKQIIRNCTTGREFDALKCQCLKKLHVNPIVNGHRADPSDVPWCLAVGFKCTVTVNGTEAMEEQPGLCTGVLVGPRWALTAEHCHRMLLSWCRPTEEQARMAPNDTSWKPAFFVEAGVTKSGIKEGVKSMGLEVYKHHTDIDIVLLRLDTAIQDSNADNIKPVPVALPGSNFYGRRCTIAGFGMQTEYDCSHPCAILPEKDGYLYEAHTTLLKPSSMCPKGWMKNLDPKPWKMCTHDERDHSDICSGDSGGPLVCPNNQGVNTLVGVLNAGSGNCYGDFYAVYGNVAMFYDRMMEVMGQVDGNNKGVVDNVEVNP